MIGKLRRKMALKEENGKRTSWFYTCMGLIGVLSCSVMIPSTVLSQANFNVKLEKALEKEFVKSGIPGCAVTIVNKDGIVFQKALGYADLKQKIPFDPFKTTMTIASVSKTFIAVALMKAIELGYFTLETPINEILPFKVSNPYFPKDTIRIRHLVTHTSGIIDNDSIYSKTYQFLINDSTESSSLALIREAGFKGGLKDTSLGGFMTSYLEKNGNLYSKSNFYRSRAGKQYSYSNIASALAAYLVEIKSRQSFAAFTQQYIFKSLGMMKASWFTNPHDLSNRAIPYYTADTCLPFYTLITYPDGGLICSAAELSLFVQEMIKTRNGSSSLLNKIQSKQLFKPFFTENDKIINYNLREYNNSVFWELYPDGFNGHTGGDPGVSTFIYFNQDLGIVFMGNQYIDTEGFEKILKEYVGKFTK